MFTGIIETIGTVQKINERQGCFEVCIQPNCIFDDLSIGDSLSVNGVCLTLTQIDMEQNLYYVTAVPETLRVTNLAQLQQNSLVNLERSLKTGSRLSGHFVQGHVDCTGEIIEISQDNSDEALLVKIQIPSHFSPYIVNKGFITIDGMSITVIEAHSQWFTVTFIPHTIQVTIVKNYRIQDKVNIETDMMGKYIHKLLLNMNLIRSNVV